ncbi:MAG: mechanosensitive ion channel family protein [Gemmatimonadota bacterium]|nr:MAG: mechanosensitive ion channel family protein [Gemmatimonadota bacterium]
MDFLEWTYFGNSVQTWFIAGGLFVAVLLAFRLARGILERRLTRLAERTRNQLDDLALDLVRGTRFFFPFVIALYAGIQPLTLPATGDKVFRGVMVIGLLLQAALWGNAVIAFWITRVMRERMDEDAAAATSIGALRFVGKLILWTVVLLLALDNLGVDITALVTGLGISGIAVALAVQNVLSDLFASLSIVLDKPFVIGDFIIVGDFLGTVEHVGLKTTRLRSLSGEQLVFSNSDLLDSRIRNYKRMRERRIVFSFGVTYQTPHARLAAIPGMVREIIEGQENTRFDRAHFKSYGASSLDFEVVYYALVPDYNVYMDIQQAINLSLYQRFEEQGIEFAYPTQTLYLRQEADEVANVE